MNIWTLLEWLGALFFVLGSFFMAHKTKIIALPWIFWILGGLSHLFYFYFGSKQFGFLISVLFGLFVSFVGLYQRCHHTHKNIILENLFFKLGIFFMICIGFSFIIPYLNFSFLNFIYHTYYSSYLLKMEWIGNLLSISANLIMASNHKLSYISWFFWTLGNIILSILTYSTQQYGLMFLQLSFCFVNLYGLYKWIYQKK